jgi:hypothetical protein
MSGENQGLVDVACARFAWLPAGAVAIDHAYVSVCVPVHGAWLSASVTEALICTTCPTFGDAGLAAMFAIEGAAPPHDVAVTVTWRGALACPAASPTTSVNV